MFGSFSSNKHGIRSNLQLYTPFDRHCVLKPCVFVYIKSIYNKIERKKLIHYKSRLAELLYHLGNSVAPRDSSEHLAHVHSSQQFCHGVDFDLGPSSLSRVLQK